MLASRFQFLVCCQWIAIVVALNACRKVPDGQAGADPVLCAARMMLADAEISRHRQDRALALVATALAADPASEATLAKFESLCRKTRWPIAISSFQFPFPIEHIVPAGDDHLLIALGDGAGTVIRWNVVTGNIEATLFPRPDSKIHSLLIDPAGTRAVVWRDDLLLLCDASSLKPIANLGAPPVGIDPTTCIGFSTDGLLLAHPVVLPDQAIVWHIRSAKDGGIIRTSEPFRSPLPIAAHMKRDALSLLRADGGVLRIPVNPTEPSSQVPLNPPATLIIGVFSENGTAAMVLQDAGKFAPPQAGMLEFFEDSDTSSLESAALMQNHPWSEHPNIWNGPLRNASDAPFEVTNGTMVFPTDQTAPVVPSSPLSAVAWRGFTMFAGTDDGQLTTLAMVTLANQAAKKPGTARSAREIAAISSNISVALTGLTFDSAKSEFVTSPPQDRARAFAALKQSNIAATFPTLDITAAAQAYAGSQKPQSPPDMIIPLIDRLARADHSRTTWPDLLTRTAHLSRNSWHQQLSTILRETDNATGPIAAIRAAFLSGNPETIGSLAATLPASGPLTATALQLALESEHPEWIQVVLLHAGNLPPLLDNLAESRIALLENRTADALEKWRDGFPELPVVRRSEDWCGWEEADFAPIYESLRSRLNENLAALRLPENPTPEQKQAAITRLIDPETVRTVGKERFASACLEAATVLAKDKEHADSAIELAALALRFGNDTPAALRAEATALTTLGRFPEARDKWVGLVTSLPPESQQPGDYAEAAYTAYEAGDNQQAMRILTTGTHRYPNDSNFALRAAWISLLTGESGRAYRFLVIGRQIGYEPEKLENATALLVVAAARAGAPEDSAAFRDELLRMNPRWADPATLDALAWPEELKAPLRPDEISTPPTGVLPEKP
ncbi:MAG: hypothetical protein V4733_11950 [Verrucomicrobiota bacterium]